ncbi:MAG: hypothetical protein R2883_06835 [Caldisericia bacterium]
MQKVILVLFVIIISLTISCGGGDDWSRFENDLFSLIVPAQSEKVQSKSSVEFTSEYGAINIYWSFDQFSVANIPAKESGRSNPGEEIIESTTATLGNRKVWWNKTRERSLITVRMVIPLDLGTIRITGKTDDENLEIIEKSIRSIVIENENYFIDSGS